MCNQVPLSASIRHQEIYLPEPGSFYLSLATLPIAITAIPSKMKLPTPIRVFAKGIVLSSNCSLCTSCTQERSAMIEELSTLVTQATSLAKLFGAKVTQRAAIAKAALTVTLTTTAARKVELVNKSNLMVWTVLKETSVREVLIACIRMSAVHQESASSSLVFNKGNLSLPGMNKTCNSVKMAMV